MGNRIYPLVPPESWTPEEDGPVLCYEVSEDTRGAHLDGDDGTGLATVHLVIQAVIEGDALAIGRVLREEWSGFRGTADPVEIDWAEQVGRSSDYVPAPDAADRGYYALTLDFEIGYTKGE